MTNEKENIPLAADVDSEELGETNLDLFDILVTELKKVHEAGGNAKKYG